MKTHQNAQPTGADCPKCGNPNTMYWCEYCAKKLGDTDVSEHADMCETCRQRMTVDKDYHLNCN